MVYIISYKNENTKGSNSEQILADAKFNINLYIHKLSTTEIQNRPKEVNTFLYVLSLDEDTKKIDLEQLNIDLVDFDNQGRRLKDLEKDSKLCENIFSNYVEIKNETVYKYYIMEIDNTLQIQNPKSVKIELDKIIREENIGIYMTI